MNVIFSKFSLPFNRPLVLNLARELGVKNLYFIGSESGCPTSEELDEFGCKLIRFDEADLFNCLFENTDWNDIEPLDESLIHSMSSYEAELMRLMEKDTQIVTTQDHTHFKRDFYDIKVELRAQNYCSFYNVISETYEEKKRKYFRYLRFWNTFLNVRSIDLYIGAFYPHFPYEYVLYRLIQRRNIPRVIASHTPIPGRWMIYKDLEKCDERLGTAFEEVRSGKFSDYRLSDLAQAEIDRIKNGTLPYYMDPAFLTKEVSDYADRKVTLLNEDKRRLRNKGKFEYNISFRTKLNLFIDKVHFKMRHSSRNAYVTKYDAFYRKVATSSVSTAENFIYVPLHYQPEASNAPIGGIFANQEIIIQMLSYFIPEGWFLYIKENPKQGFMHRNPEFYYDLLQNEKVRLVSKEFSTFDLIRNAKAVATIAGTAAWESLFNGIPVLLFGYSPLMYAPGVFNIRNNEQCRDAIVKIFNTFRVNQDDVLKFVKALDLTTVPAVNDYIQKQKFGYSDEHYLQIMKGAYLDFIRRNFSFRKNTLHEKV